MAIVKRGFSAITAMLLATGLVACGDDLGPEASGTVSLSVTAAGAGSGSASLAAGTATATAAADRDTRGEPDLSISETDGQGNTLVLDSVQVVLREIELERQEDECDDVASGEDDDECEEFEADIRLLRVPMDGSVDRVVSLDGVPADVYDELEFEVHKPDDDDAEGRAFIEDNPTFADVSVRAKGTFNGNAFVFTSDLNEDQEIELSPPLEVGGSDAAQVNVTLRLDVTGWFADGSGTFVDPSTANDGGANENLVEDNIRDSIEAFEDDDEDGEADDAEDDDG